MARITIDSTDRQEAINLAVILVNALGTHKPSLPIAVENYAEDIYLTATRDWEVRRLLGQYWNADRPNNERVKIRVRQISEQML